MYYNLLNQGTLNTGDSQQPFCRMNEYSFLPGGLMGETENQGRETRQQAEGSWPGRQGSWLEFLSREHCLFAVGHTCAEHGGRNRGVERGVGGPGPSRSQQLTPAGCLPTVNSLMHSHFSAPQGDSVFESLCDSETRLDPGSSQDCPLPGLSGGITGRGWGILTGWICLWQGTLRTPGRCV